MVFRVITWIITVIIGAVRALCENAPLGQAEEAPTKWWTQRPCPPLSKAGHNPSPGGRADRKWVFRGWIRGGGGGVKHVAWKPVRVTVAVGDWKAGAPVHLFLFCACDRHLLQAFGPCGPQGSRCTSGLGQGFSRRHGGSLGGHCCILSVQCS